jgi:YesN/AraC family two-component response regulator
MLRDEVALFTLGAEGLANAAKASVPDAAEEKPLLLIVEDNRDVIDYLALFLSDEFQIQTAENGAVGIEKAQEMVPDLIVSDVMMPEKDGFQLCDTLKNDVRTSHVPIVLLTAKSDVSSRIAGLKRGADAYLPKPFDEQELRVQLQNLLQQRRLLQQRYREGGVTAEDMPEDIRIEDAFLRKLREIVEVHIDQKIEISWLAKQVNLGRSQLSRKTKALTGKTPTEFLRGLRINHSKHLLRQTDKNISEVAYAVGYDDPAYFSRVFREEVGLSPSEWRDKGGDAT